jgi:hypothetical protein
VRRQAVKKTSKQYAGRRSAREAEAARRKPATVELPDLSWREAAAVLHDELNALPEKYRLPLVLCYLHGLSKGAAAERLGLPQEKIVINIERFGNTTAATIPLALNDALIDGRIKRGDRVLLASVGAGFTAGAVLMRWGI